MKGLTVDSPILTSPVQDRRRLRRALVTGLIAGLLAMAVSGAALALFTKQTWSTNLLVVGTQDAGDPVRNAGTYAAVISSDQTVTSAVQQAANVTADDLKGDLVAAAVQSTAVVQVTFTAPTSARAQAGIAAVQSSLPTLTAADGTLSNVQLKVVRPATEPVKSTTPWLETLAAGFLAGFAIAALITWFWHPGQGGNVLREL